MDKYYHTSIEFLKNKKRDKEKKRKEKASKLYLADLNKKLYFIEADIWSTAPLKGEKIYCLIDTGAANSLIHSSIVTRLGLKYQSTKMTLATATGFDEEAIKGIVHLKFVMQNSEGENVASCANFIVTQRLNGLQAIIGADVLFDDDRTKSISKNSLSLLSRDKEVVLSLIHI